MLCSIESCGKPIYLTASLFSDKNFCEEHWNLEVDAFNKTEIEFSLIDNKGIKEFINSRHSLEKENSIKFPNYQKDLLAETKLYDQNTRLN